ncbi:hypothetical protein TAO_1597 [Candidatus Nitrosoglobus terrae]|uniref:Uncharacterized protein n=1 Tax=Candidatus Nitrosoglobus terrae TaxID=1630141 RepID=A0A1Q2SPE4_9GAMM|nr:hypothetical protein TAO_1597 [Candidatus Nitrosoglobus terrae]
MGIGFISLYLLLLGAMGLVCLILYQIYVIIPMKENLSFMTYIRNLIISLFAYVVAH